MSIHLSIMLFKNGPLIKNLFTHQLELIAKCLLHIPNKINFEIRSNHTKPSIYVTIGELDINVSALLRKANFSHLTLDSQDSIALFHHYNIYTSPQDFYMFDEMGKNPKYKSLTPAEGFAIHSYTGSDYIGINSILSETPQKHIDTTTFLKSVFLASGLNKIFPEGELEALSFRGESHLSYDEILYRITLASEGGGLTEENRFMSTSIDYSISDGFNSNCMIIFDGLYGKDIISLSHFPQEQEFLLTPGLIAWEDYIQIDGNNYFYAKVVAPLIDGKDEHTFEELLIFKKLYEFAQQQGIDTDFISAQLKYQLTDNSILTLEDCISSPGDFLENFTPNLPLDPPLQYVSLMNHHPLPTVELECLI